LGDNVDDPLRWLFPRIAFLKFPRNSLCPSFPDPPHRSGVHWALLRTENYVHPIARRAAGLENHDATEVNVSLNLVNQRILAMRNE